MLVHRKPKTRYQIQIPMTSLIDIVFMLLIYFLLTTNFMVDEGIKIKLPRANAVAPQAQEEITVYVDVEGQPFIQNKPISHDQLFIVLKQKINHQTDKLVVIKADRAVLLDKAVKVMDIAKAAGAQRLCLATEKGL
ncbi:MAG: biopolymer transporter ExbD [Desulfobacterales bacterium]|nr:biopolymer transporter ExbD [Desulfobacterales bacterium]